jgi:hypothetical protein
MLNRITHRKFCSIARTLYLMVEEMSNNNTHIFPSVEDNENVSS